MPPSQLKPVSLLARFQRRFPIFRYGVLKNTITYLPAIGCDPIASRQIGPITFQCDVRERFQRYMILDIYEGPLLDVVRAVLRPGDTYVDFGAQLGYTAAFAAQRIGPTGRMVLVEPDPAALAFLKPAIATANPKTVPEIHLHEVAVSDTPGELLFEQATTLGHSRILRHERELRDGKLLRVPVETAAAVLAASKVEQIRLMKIDVEGHELHLLASLQPLLAAGRIDVLCIEKNFELLRPQWILPMHALIARHGYLGFREDNLEPVTRASLTSEKVLVENLIYTKDPSHLGSLLTDRSMPTANDFAPAEMERWAELFLASNDPEGRALRVIAAALHADFGPAILEAEALLQEHPELHDLRGHLAHWYAVKGQRKQALLTYEELHRQRPGDSFVAGEVRRLRAEVG